MATCRQLSEENEKLKRRIDSLEKKIDEVADAVEDIPCGEKDESWKWDTEAAETVACYMEDAIDWEECPYQPKDFNSWEDLHTFFETLESY